MLATNAAKLILAARPSLPDVDVDEDGDDEGELTITVDLVPVELGLAPEITVEPESVRVCEVELLLPAPNNPERR